MSFIDTLLKNPLVAFGTIILAIIGIILTIVSIYKGRGKKSIRYNIETNLLIENFEQKIKNITIQYSGKDINSLSVTKFLFWNNGTETIRQNDIPIKDKFSITIKDDNYILDKSIIEETNKSNNIDINLSDDKKKIDIDFEYFDKGDSFTIQIFHTGSKSTDFDINGSIMGFGKILNGFTINKKNLSNIFSFIIGMLISMLPLFFLLINYTINTYKQNIVISIISTIYILIFIIGGFSAFKSMNRRAQNYRLR